MLSQHCEERCFRFWDIVNDCQTKKERDRAITGLKSWQCSQKHRLTETDNAMIESYVKHAKKGIRYDLDYTHRKIISAYAI